MPDQIFKNGLILEFDTSAWWQTRPDGDVDAELNDNGYSHTFTLGQDLSGSTIDVEIHHAHHRGHDPAIRPPFLLLVTFCGECEFVFAASMWDALHFLRQLSPIITAEMLTAQAEARETHLEKHARKDRWEQFCFHCQHERRMSS